MESRATAPVCGSRAGPYPEGVSLAGDRPLDRKSLLQRARLEFNREYAETGGGRTDSNSTCRGLNSASRPKSVGCRQVADNNRYLRNSSLGERICLCGPDGHDFAPSCDYDYNRNAGRDGRFHIRCKILSWSPAVRVSLARILFFNGSPQSSPAS